MWPAMMMFEFHNPVNCPARRLGAGAICEAALVFFSKSAAKSSRTMLQSKPSLSNKINKAGGAATPHAA